MAQRTWEDRELSLLEAIPDAEREHDEDLQNDDLEEPPASRATTCSNDGSHRYQASAYAHDNAPSVEFDRDGTGDLSAGMDALAVRRQVRRPRPSGGKPAAALRPARTGQPSKAA